MGLKRIKRSNSLTSTKSDLFAVVRSLETIFSCPTNQLQQKLSAEPYCQSSLRTCEVRAAALC